MTSSPAITIMAVGDVFVDLDIGMNAFRETGPLFATAQIVSGNCEGVYSNFPERAPSARHVMVTSPARAKGLGSVPFHVMSCANNHIADGGHRGLFATLDALRAEGIATCGAGANMEEALRPAILQRDGVKAAFLSFASIFPAGYEARAESAGLAPLRIRTHYANPDVNFWEPGIDPIISTEPFEEDVERLERAIAGARAAADVVVVSCHWGNSKAFERVQPYEQRLARMAAGMGADAVLCHHHHSLRGVELVGGSAIFYGLGAYAHHFAHFDLTPAQLAASRKKHGDRAFYTREDFPHFPFHPDARMSMVAILNFGRDGSRSFGFVPAMARADGSMQPLRPGEAEAEQIIRYVERITGESGYSTKFEVGVRDGYAFVQTN